MFAVTNTEDADKFITNSEGDILVSDPETNTQFWVPANQIHEINSPEEEFKTDATEAASGLNSVDEHEIVEKVSNWSHENTLLLIELYQEHESNFERMVKKQVWQRITTKLNLKASKRFTEANVENKWKALKRTYKNIKFKNSQSGQKRKYWEYFLIMDEIMRKKPEINPPVTASSTSGIVIHTQQSESDSEHTETSSSLASPTYFDDDKLKNDRSTRKAFFKRKTGPNVNDRHKEKMARQDRFLEIFEKMVDKM